MDPSEQYKRWRLILGREAMKAGSPGDASLTPDEMGMDRALEALYHEGREGGLGPSSPQVHRWLGDIRRYFPKSVVSLLQQDAIDRLGIKELLAEPEMAEKLQPDPRLVATILSLKDLIPDRARATAALVVRRLVHQLEARLKIKLSRAVHGALDRASRNLRPRPNEIDLGRTVRRNLKHYQPDLKTIIPERVVGYGRRRRHLKTVVILMDQSASMATSVVYAGVYASVLASLPALRTHAIAFDTGIADLTEYLDDPVEMLFGTQLGGGTDIAPALRYAASQITKPQDTVLILLSDLFDGGSEEESLAEIRALRQLGVRIVCLLALDDEGTPAYNEDLARRIVRMGIPVFACTPDRFPDVMADALNG